MENATKALIIAAAILIAIVLISLGVYVLGIGKESVGDINIDEQAVMSFNSKFESFEGPNELGSNVNALLSRIQANNRTEGTNGKQVTLDPAGDITSLDQRASTGRSYNIVMNPDPNTGLITSVTITENT